MHETGICLFDEAMEISKGDKNTLQHGGGRLANAYRIHKEILGVSTLSDNLAPTMPIGADTLTEVASQPDFTGVLDDSMNTLIPLPVPNVGLRNNAGVVFSDSMAIGDVPPSGPSETPLIPTTSYSPAVQHQRLAYREQNHPPEMFSQHDPQQYGFDYAGITTREQNPQFRRWPAEHEVGLQDDPSISGLDMFYPDAVPNGYDFLGDNPEDWTRLIKQMYSAYEGGTSHI
jgi:hypothetical protein